MVILSKKIKAGEVRWKGLVVPKNKKDLFPNPGVLFDLYDGKTTYKVKLDRLHRIRLAQWFANHPEVKAGDEIIFSKENGAIHIRLGKTTPSKTVSLKDLLGKETSEGKIIDIQQTPDGPVAIVQNTKEVPLDKILAKL